MCFFNNLFEEYISAKKLMEKRTDKKLKTSLEKFVTNKNGSLNLEQQTDLHLENKINLLEDFIENLKQKFIFKKITDVSMNIRLMICDYIVKISNKHFSEFFDDDSIKFYPFFLIDPSYKIKLKYLQIIYGKLEDMDENDFECIIKILKESRDLILNICIKDEKTIAKRGIKIIELISKHNILDLKTVNLLLPHLFNPDPNIRNLISNIVLNYILNFESRNVINEAKEEDENNETENNDAEERSKSKAKKEEDLMDVCDGEVKEENKNNSPSKAKYKYSLENLIEIFEFFSKLTEKDEKMIKVLVDNFYSKMDVFKNFTLFFDLIDMILNRVSIEPAKENLLLEENENRNNSNSEYNKLLKICLIVLKYSIEKLQDEIDNAKTSNEMSVLMKEQIPLNEEFLNNLISRTPSYIRKIIINEEILYETFVEITNLFENFKIYNYNLIKFDLDKVYNILEELQKVFFQNFNLKNENEQYLSYNNFMSNAIDNIGKIIIKLINFLSINKMNDDFARMNERNIIKDLCSRLFDKISSKILSNKFFLNEEIIEELSNEQAEELIYLLVRLDCVLNYFGSFSDNFISQLNFVKFQNFIFNLITHYRSKVQLIISERITVFCKQSKLEAEGESLDKKHNKKSNNADNNLKALEESAQRNEFEFNILEYFLQNFTNYGLKVDKSLNLILLTKIIFNIDSITNENNISLSASIANPTQIIESLHKLNKHETSHFYEAYLKYINNLLLNFELFLKFEFDYSVKFKDYGNNEVELSEGFNKFIQEKNCLNLEIKSNFVCLIFDIMIYISSEKLEMYSSNSDLKMKFLLNDFILTSIEKFLKKEFVFFFYMSSKKLKEINDELRTLEILQENEDLEENQSDKLELLNEFKNNIESVVSIKTIFFKNICESYSKLLIQNLGMFKNRNLVTLFFETFYLIKYPVIIESINSIVFENLLEKEISYYLKDEDNNKINWMIFYFTKIAVKLFSKNSSMFNFEEYMNKQPEKSSIKNENEMDVSDDIPIKKNEITHIQETFNFYDFFNCKNFAGLESYEFKSKKNQTLNSLLINEEEKLFMLKRYFDVYLKIQRKIKSIYSKEHSQSMENKDKKFLEEFICKSLNYALQSKVIKEIEIESITDLKKEVELNKDIEEENSTTEKKSSNKKEVKFEKRIYVQNIKFLDLIKYILKNSLFITEIEYKTFLMLFVKLVKNIETTDNVNRHDIKMIEIMKGFLLNKAKLYINKDDDKVEENSENNSDEDDKKEENEKEEKANNRKNKGAKKKNKQKEKEENHESDSEEENISDQEAEDDAKQKKGKKADKKENRKTLKKDKNKREKSNLSEVSVLVGKKRVHEDVKIIFIVQLIFKF